MSWQITWQLGHQLANLADGSLESLLAAYLFVGLPSLRDLAEG